jgi:hypothetical protein
MPTAWAKSPKSALINIRSTGYPQSRRGHPAEKQNIEIPRSAQASQCSILLKRMLREPQNRSGEGRGALHGPDGSGLKRPQGKRNFRKQRVSRPPLSAKADRLLTVDRTQASCISTPLLSCVENFSLLKRANRSNRNTATASNVRRLASAISRSSAGRRSFEPLTPWSIYSAAISQPRRTTYSRSAASCISVDWSCVETLA